MSLLLQSFPLCLNLIKKISIHLEQNDSNLSVDYTAGELEISDNENLLLSKSSRITYAGKVSLNWSTLIYKFLLMSY